MTTEAIRERLQEYIRFADDKKVEAIYTMVEDEIVEGLDLWQDADFLSEMKSRIEDFESSTVECQSWEDVKLQARKSLKS